MNRDSEIIQMRSKIVGYFISKGITIQEAEDLYQDLYIKLKITIENGSYIDDGKFENWVMRISKNFLIDFFRKRSRINNKTHSTFKDKRSFKERNNYIFLPSPDLSAEDQIIKEESIDELKKAIEILDPPQREVIEMRVFKNMAFREVVEETGRSLNTCLGNYRYGIRNLKKIML